MSLSCARSRLTAKNGIRGMNKIVVYNGAEVLEKKDFIADLEQFLRERNIQLATSDYDSLQIWDLKPGENPIHSNGIEDRRDEK